MPKKSNLNRVLKKVAATKAPSAKAARKLTANVGNGKIKVYDLNEKVASTPPVKGKDLARKGKLLGANSKGSLQHTIRRDPIPEPISMLFHPPLPKRKRGDKPNVAALLYAYKEFLAFYSAFNRRNLGDPVARERYYQERKQAFYKAMQDAGLADLYDWTDLARQERAYARLSKAKKG